MKTAFKLIVTVSALALGFVSTDAYGQAAGGAGGRRGGNRGGAGNLAAPLPTIDALTTALTLTPDEVTGITPILADMTTAQADIVKVAADYDAARTANIAKISALLTETQKPLVMGQFLPPVGGGAPGAAGGRRGVGGAPVPAPAPPPGP